MDDLQIRNDIIELTLLIKHTIETLKSQTYDDIDILELKSIIDSKEELYFKLKEKEDLCLSDNEKKLEKIMNSRKKYEQLPEILRKYNENIKNVELLAINENKLIIYLRNLREQELEDLKNKLKDEKEKENEFYQDKNLIISILESFIDSLEKNNLYGTYLTDRVNTPIFNAFVENKLEVNEQIIDYFREIFHSFEFGNCLYFSSSIYDVKYLLENKDIRSILNKNYHIKVR